MVARSGDGWTLAPDLVRLVDQLDRAYPDRPRQSDGSIGDARHQAESFSDHNPRRGVDGQWYVTAVDLTAAPWSDDLAALLTTDPRVKYIIWQRRYYQRIRWSSADPLDRWVPYNGADPHTSHIHLSVVMPLVLDTRDWAIPHASTPPETDMDRAETLQLLRDWWRQEIRPVMRADIKEECGKATADIREKLGLPPE